MAAAAAVDLALEAVAHDSPTAGASGLFLPWQLRHSEADHASQRVLPSDDLSSTVLSRDPVQEDQLQEDHETDRTQQELQDELLARALQDERLDQLQDDHAFIPSAIQMAPSSAAPVSMSCLQVPNLSCVGATSNGPINFATGTQAWIAHYNLDPSSRLRQCGSAGHSCVLQDSVPCPETTPAVAETTKTTADEVPVSHCTH